MTWNWANRISITRILLIPVFVTVLLYYTPGAERLRLAALGIFLIAILTDAIDGYVARVYQQRTAVGVLLDPLADKLLLVTAFILFAASPPLVETFGLPVWVSIVVVSRDIILVLGTVVVYLMTGSLAVNPTIWGKLTTASQMATICGLLVRAPFAPLLWTSAVICTLVSGVDYMLKGSRLINNGKGMSHDMAGARR